MTIEGPSFESHQQQEPFSGGQNAFWPVSKYKVFDMANFYQPNLGANPDDPFARDENGKLVRRSYWLDLPNQALVLAMTQGVGANLRMTRSGFI